MTSEFFFVHVTAELTHCQGRSHVEMGGAWPLQIFFWQFFNVSPILEHFFNMIEKLLASDFFCPSNQKFLILPLLSVHF